ncbi:LOW QUALITY PROTEIN: ornithine decarboxylase-like, partial [Impatiens glandulifera]
VVGVSFHIGSGDADCRSYHSAISAARDVFDTATKLGFPRMRVLNIGGGFTAGSQFIEAAEAVNFAIQTYFKDEPDLEIIAEPGRYFAEHPFTLAANVIGKRVRGELREYYINDGLYGSFNCIQYDHAVITVKAFMVESDPENVNGFGSMTYGSTVFGPTCDALDTVVEGYELPEMEIGDWMVFPNIGAYSSASGSNFNGFKGVGLSTHLVYSKGG